MFKPMLALGFILLHSAFVTASAKPLQEATNHYGTPIKASVLITNNTKTNKQSLSVRSTLGTSSRMTVYLMNMKLTSTQKRQLGTYPAIDDVTSYAAANSRLPSSVELGMNNVPVLDQGMHGSCATFAVTAALDAILNKGDYISELCTLQLGEYLSRRSYMDSGWEGASSSSILNRYTEFGFISKSDQAFYTCGGLKDYPLSDTESVGNEMTSEDYFHVSQDMRGNMHWYALLTPYQRFGMSYINSQAPNQLIGSVKQALASKHAQTSSRVIVGALLPLAYCSAGACGKFHQPNDTWTVTRSIRADEEPDLGAHAMVITGYNDDAIVTDEDGGRHKGVFILRNSWGEKAGDHGDYYMTYEFFKHFVINVEVIAYIPASENEEE